jgi:hypothetical protein
MPKNRTRQTKNGIGFLEQTNVSKLVTSKLVTSKLVTAKPITQTPHMSMTTNKGVFPTSF